MKNSLNESAQSYKKTKKNLLMKACYQKNGKSQTYLLCTKRGTGKNQKIRPISLTSMICKLMKSFIGGHTCIIQYMEENGLTQTNMDFERGDHHVSMHLLEVFGETLLIMKQHY